MNLRAGLGSPQHPRRYSARIGAANRLKSILLQRIRAGLELASAVLGRNAPNQASQHVPAMACASMRRTSNCKVTSSLTAQLRGRVLGMKRMLTLGNLAETLLMKRLLAAARTFCSCCRTKTEAAGRRSTVSQTVSGFHQTYVH